MPDLVGQQGLGPTHSSRVPFLRPRSQRCHAPCPGSRLSFPVDRRQFFAMVDQDRPQSVKDASGVPAVHGPMHRRVAAELFG